MPRITVLPVSGGGFPSQLGLLSELTSAGITPEVIFGASGGNVSAYIGLAGDWSPYGIRRVTETMNCEFFSRSWWPPMLRWMPSWSIGYFRGSIYRSGSGTTELFKSMFTKPNIQETEIWTGTRNRTTSKGQLFCNLSQSQLKIELFEPHLMNCMPLTYLHGDIEKISRVSVASASIPILVPEQEVDGEYYVDGGTAFASPLTPFQDVLRGSTPLHLDYLNSFDALSTIGPRSHLNLYQNGEATAHEIVESLILHDRLNGIELVRDGNPDNHLHYHEGYGSYKVLRELETLRSKACRSFLELFPVKDMSVNLTDFTNTEIIKIITETQKNYRYRLWYRDPVGESCEEKDLWHRT